MKSKSISNRLPFVVAVLITLAAGSAVNGQSTISGHIFDDHRSPLSNIFVELQDENYQNQQTTRTDNSGVYFFRNLRSGLTYYVHVKTIGTNFVEQTQQVDIATRPQRNIGGNIVSGSTFESRDFFLKPDNQGARTVPARTIFAQEIPTDAKKAFQAASIALEKKNSAEAVQFLIEAVRIFPDYFDALEILGTEYVRSAKYAEAITVLERAVAVNPRSYAGWYGRGYSQYTLKMTDAAIASIKQAVVLQPASADAFLLLGAAYRQAGQFELAEKNLKKANDLTSGGSADVHWNLALLYAYNLKRYDAAASELESYLKTAKAPNEPQIKKLIDQFRKRSKGSSDGS